MFHPFLNAVRRIVYPILLLPHQLPPGIPPLQLYAGLRDYIQRGADDTRPYKRRDKCPALFVGS